MADLHASPGGRAVRGLHFRTGYTRVSDLFNVLRPDLPHVPLNRLTLANMGLTPDLLDRCFYRISAVRLSELDLTENYGIGSDGVRVLTDRPHALATLSVLRLADCGVSSVGAMALARSEAVAGLRMLDLSRNPLTGGRAVMRLAGSPHLAGLRSLDLSRCKLGDAAVRHLTKATFWPNLVELDLRGNHINEVGAGHLMKAPVPPDLTALLLDPDPLGPRAAGRLRGHFGERVVFVAAS